MPNIPPLQKQSTHIHMIGIGGTGMCGIAEVLHHLGYQVSGSDLYQSAVTQRLSQLGIKVYQGHQAEQAQRVDVIVVSSAIDKNNPEVAYAMEQHIPVIPRAQMLAELMRFHYSIAVAGTHGKTTTTSLIASIFAKANLDPTFVIGGCLKKAGSNAALGQSQYFIAEADESDASFLHLQPMLTVVTNIDADHMGTYEQSFEKLKAAFVSFLLQLPFDGHAIVYGDDPHIQAILPEVARSIITYGFDPSCQFWVDGYRQEGMVSHFTVHWDDHCLEISLNLPGKHNVLNALAAIAVALTCNINIQAIQQALVNFDGIGRRSEWIGEFRSNIVLMDDYGHHPQEILATLQGMRAAYPNRRLLWIYQPHRYSRTQQLFDELVMALSTVDVLILLEIYPAGEQPIEGIDSKALCRAIRQRGKVEPIYVPDIAQVMDILPDLSQPNDVIITQGAGSIAKLAGQIQTWLTDES